MQLIYNWFWLNFKVWQLVIIDWESLEGCVCLCVFTITELLKNCWACLGIFYHLCWEPNSLFEKEFHLILWFTFGCRWQRCWKRFHAAQPSSSVSLSPSKLVSVTSYLSSLSFDPYHHIFPSFGIFSHRHHAMHVQNWLVWEKGLQEWLKFLLKEKLKATKEGSQVQPKV